jgi:hypothetical protein
VLQRKGGKARRAGYRTVAGHLQTIKRNDPNLRDLPAGEAALLLLAEALSFEAQLFEPGGSFHGKPNQRVFQPGTSEQKRLRIIADMLRPASPPRRAGRPRKGR